MAPAQRHPCHGEACLSLQGGLPLLSAHLGCDASSPPTEDPFALNWWNSKADKGVSG